MKEAYRLNKLELLDNAADRNVNISILFSLSSNGFEKYTSLDFQKINISMIALMEKINIHLANQ